MKKFLCVVLCLVFLFACGCNNKAAKSKTKKDGKKEITAIPTETVNLLYAYGDGFNPYTANTVENRRLCTLLYDPLVKVTDSFGYECILAESAVLEGSTCTVTLRDAAFTDGSPLTSDDVVYSYKLAQSSATGGFAANFYEVSSVSAADAKTVVFSLTRSDPYFINLLSFPIIKAGSDTAADSDGVAIPPIGCGRFKLSEDRKSFVFNPDYFDGFGSISQIFLLDAPDADSVSHYVEVGACDIYYTDDSNGQIVRMSGKRTDINTTRFIYIGINETYGQLNQKEMRYAISSAVNRKEIVSSAYFESADVATGFFHNSIESTRPANTLKETADEKITVENLKKMGYNEKNADGYYINSSGNHPQFTLLVNYDNLARVNAAKLIADQCKAAGIEINVVGCTYEQYLARLAAGDFQLYMGETQLLPNMDFSPLSVPGGAVSYGVVETPGEDSVPLSATFAAFYGESIGPLDLAGALISEMPQIPICYRNGLLFYNSRISGGVTASLCDVYYSINDYTF